MNQIQFETSKVYGVFVKDITPEFTKLYPQYAHYINQGFVSKLTDEQKERVVDKSKFYNIYLDYVKGYYVEHLSLQKSFDSLLTSLNALLVNPYGDEPNHLDYKHKNQFNELVFTDINLSRYSQDYDNWQTAKQNVGQWILLTANK